MAKKKKTPLYQVDESDPEYTGEDTDETTTDDESLFDSNVMQSDLFRDKVHGTDTTMFSSPKEIDTTAIDERISKIEKPAGGTVWDKQAAYYRQKGEGDVLRGQKDWEALTSPTITLYNERVAAADAKFELLKQQIPETDFSTIFGENGESKIPMPIVDEVKNISATVRTDLKELSRMNINDPRYDELRKKVEKDQDMLVAFDEINQKLLTIRNDIESNGNDSTSWSKGMSEGTRAMWMDIYTGEGKNIKIIDGKLQWVNPGQVSYDFGIREDQIAEISNPLWSEKLKGLGGAEEGLGLLNKFSGDGEVNSKTVRSWATDPGEGMVSEGYDKEDILKVQRELKKLYPNHEFGTTGDNGDGIDGVWGDKTQAAYEMYLKDKDKLEKEWFDENMSEEDKKKYQVIEGKGALKDLSKIGDEPIMNSAKAQELSFQMQNYMTASIQAGANAKGDFTAQTKYKQALNNIKMMYDGMSIQDQTSLLFDGMGAEDNTSVNTSSFIDSILAANEGLELDDLIEGGLMESYKDPNDLGKEKTLRTMFKDWYLNEVESQTSSLKPPRGSGSGSSSGSGSGKGKGKDLKTRPVTLTFSEDGEKVSSAYDGKSTLHGQKIETGEISMTGTFLDNLIGGANYFDDDHDYKITSDGVIYYYEHRRHLDNFGKWVESGNSINKIDSEEKRNNYNTIMRQMNSLLGSEFSESSYTDYYKMSKGALTSYEDDFADIDKLTTEGHTIGGHKFNSDRIIFYNDDNTTGVLTKLNDEYGKYGFKFFEADHAGGGAGDAVDITYTSPFNPDVEYKYSEMVKGAGTDAGNNLLEYDNWTHESDMATAEEVVRWMKKVLKETAMQALNAKGYDQIYNAQN